MTERTPREMLPCSYLDTFIILAVRRKYTSLMKKMAVRLKQNYADSNEIRILSSWVDGKTHDRYYRVYAIRYIAL